MITIPYIELEKRMEFNEHLTFLANKIDTWGDFNYIVSKLLKELYVNWGLGYNFINNAMGVLVCIHTEFYRTIAAPYEEEKRKMNGDI